MSYLDPFWIYAIVLITVILALGIMPSLKDPDQRDKLPRSSLDL